jgi:hypothetical protein
VPKGPPHIVTETSQERKKKKKLEVLGSLVVVEKQRHVPKPIITSCTKLGMNITLVF